MKKEEYKIPEIESIEAFGAEALCQITTSFGGSTSDYGQDNEYIF